MSSARVGPSGGFFLLVIPAILALILPYFGVLVGRTGLEPVTP